MSSSHISSQSRHWYPRIKPFHRAGVMPHHVWTAVFFLSLPLALFAQNPKQEENAKSAVASAAGQTLQSFQTKSEGVWTVSKNRITGLPRMLMGAKSVSYGATPVEAAQAFLAENVGMFLPGSLGKTKDEKINLKVSSSKALPGSTVVEFGQEYQGIPVYGAFLVVMVDSYGRIVHVTSTTDPRVTFSTTPTTFQQVDNAFRSTQASQSIPVTAISNTLVIFPGDIPRLAYQVLYNIGDPSEPWEYVLDAENGLILKSKRLVKDQGKKRPNEAAIGQQTQRIQNEDDQKLGQKNTSDNPLAIYKVHVDLRTGNTTTKKSDESGEKLYSNTGVPDYSTSPQASEKRRTIEK